MAAALLLADAEPETRGLLERRLPHDGFKLVPAHGRFDLVLVGDVERVDRWVERAPVIVLGHERADTGDCIHAEAVKCGDDLRDLVGKAAAEIDHDGAAGLPPVGRSETG